MTNTCASASSSRCAAHNAPRQRGTHSLAESVCGRLPHAMGICGTAMSLATASHAPTYHSSVPPSLSQWTHRIHRPGQRKVGPDASGPDGRCREGVPR